MFAVAKQIQLICCLMKRGILIKRDIQNVSTHKTHCCTFQSPKKMNFFFLNKKYLLNTRNVDSTQYILHKHIFTFGLITGFPFYTIGRFQNTPCEGKNKLSGTCVLYGECRSGGGISTGPCSSITRQAVCCICKFPVLFFFFQTISIHFKYLCVTTMRIIEHIGSVAWTIIFSILHFGAIFSFLFFRPHFNQINKRVQRQHQTIIPTLLIQTIRICGTVAAKRNYSFIDRAFVTTSIVLPIFVFSHSLAIELFI